MKNLVLENKNDAFNLLKKLGAPHRLIKHHELVSEASELLIEEYENLKLKFDRKKIELGVAIHDVGKIMHLKEMDGPGSQHEVYGRDLLLKHGVSSEIAQCCVSHAQWNVEGITFEELSIALSDKLWKGKREPELELLVIDMVAKKLETDRWTVFQDLDSVFEKIASDGDDRLNRSKV